MQKFHIFGLIVISSVLYHGTYAHYTPNFQPSHAGIVHLFEWKFNDIANECERYLGPNGFGGVQVSPVSENIILDHRPWYERYQPISYKIATRSGNEDEFKAMVERCNRAGVRIYVDFLANHMTGFLGEARGTGGSTANVGERKFPGVPFGPNDFHWPCNINNYNDPANVRNCELNGLPDLNQGTPYVREKIIEFMNRLIDMGIAGFRMDASKHMWPSDLQEIYSNLKNLSLKAFQPNTQPYIYQEVIDLGGEAIKKTDYTFLGAVTEFKFSDEIGRAFGGKNDLHWLKNWGRDWGLLDSRYALVFVDNHDNQRSGNGDILTYKQRKNYIMATAFMLAHPYGTPRVMSSFQFSSFDQGPPTDANEAIISPKINETDDQCINGWICEHRWPEIRNMIKFRRTVGVAPRISWWDNGKNQIAFCRGIRGFIVFNNENTVLEEKLFTCLPTGTYCDVITGEERDGQCTGGTIKVDENGEAMIRVVPEIGILAIHIGEKLDALSRNEV